MMHFELEKRLNRLSRFHYYLKINNNRCVFLRLIEKKRRKIYLSLHQIFFSAPDSILLLIIRYIEKDDSEALNLLRAYATKKIISLDYSSSVNIKKLKTKGRFYNLKEIFQDLNNHYFEGKLDLFITWFATPSYRKRSSLTFGSYEKCLKLIRINQILDSNLCPSYFLSYIVFHEMLHHVCPMYIDSRGRRRMHTADFRKKEKIFSFYKEAVIWEKKFLNSFFKHKEKDYVRS